MESKKCSFIRKDGKKCNSYAKKGYDYCAFHIKKHCSEEKITHGKYASKETLGIPSGYIPAYDDFYAEEDFMNLRPEIALLRTMVKMLSDILQSGNSAVNSVKYDNFCDMITDHVRSSVQFERIEDCVEFEKGIFAIFQSVTSDDISPEVYSHKNLAMISDLVDKIRKTAESAKKISEGFSFRVELDSNILIRFVKEVIYTQIKDPILLNAIGEKALAFSTRAFKQQNDRDTILQLNAPSMEDEVLSLGDFESTMEDRIV